MIVAYVSQKGSAGKTSTIFNTAVALKEMGVPVICMDLDPEQSDIQELCDDNRIPCFAPELTELSRILTRHKTTSCISDPIRLIECPPRIDESNLKGRRIALSVLRLAHVAVSPCPCEYFHFKALETVVEVADIAREENPDLHLRVLPVMYSAPQKEERQSLYDLPGVTTCRITIPRNSEVSRAIGRGKSVLETLPKSAVSKAYRSHAKELVEWREGKF